MALLQRVFVIDPQPIFRRGLAAVIGTCPTLGWAGEADSLPGASAALVRARPDVLLLASPAHAQPEPCTVVELARLLPALRIIGVREATARAADGADRTACAGCPMPCLARDASVDELLRLLHAGPAAHPLTRTGARGEHQPVLLSDLTPREMQVLAQMAEGHNNLAIAKRLGVSVPTVKFHVGNILSKFDAADRTSAVLAALRHGMLALPG
jgi:two-component system, NarL family, response regulator LiaR